MINRSRWPAVLYLLPVLLLWHEVLKAHCTACTAGSSAGLTDVSLSQNSSYRYIAQLSYDKVGFNAVSPTHKHYLNGVEIKENSVTNLNVLSFFSLIRLNERLQLSVLLPFQHAEGSLNNQSGMADGSLCLQWTAFNKPKFKLYSGVGAELPTGKLVPDIDNAIVRFGSGNTDGIVQLKAYWFSNKWIFATQNYGKITRNNKDGDNQGNVCQFNLSATRAFEFFRKKQDSLSCNAPYLSLQPSLSLQYDYYGIQKKNDVYVGNSDGKIIWANAQISINRKNYSIPLSFFMPVKQFWKTEAPQASYRLRVSFIIKL